MQLAKKENSKIMPDTIKKDFDIKSNKIIIIESRFGKLEIETDKAIYFPKGLYGFKEDLHFGLTSFPVAAGLEDFRLLQCLNDPGVSFPVIPSSFENVFIDKSDMQECIETIEVEKENFLMLFIANSRKTPKGDFEVSINTKAPIVMDANLKIGVQYVFTNNKYSTNHKIGDDIKNS